MGEEKKREICDMRFTKGQRRPSLLTKERGRGQRGRPSKMIEEALWFIERWKKN